MYSKYGAQIGCAMINLDGPIVFCVVSRYHDGAFVVFSGVLNDHMEVIAIEGSYASVIRGAPDEAVVFSRAVTTRRFKDPLVTELEAHLTQAEQGQQARLHADLRTSLRSEKLGKVAEEFETVRNMQLPRSVGSVDAIIPARDLRPYFVGSVGRSLARRNLVATASTT